MRRGRPRFSLPRAVAIDRRCAYCGDWIDPIDWCPDCRKAKAPCGKPHKRLRKRSDAAFCNDECRRTHRRTFERDILPSQRGSGR